MYFNLNLKNKLSLQIFSIYLPTVLEIYFKNVIKEFSVVQKHLKKFQKTFLKI